MKKGKLSLTEQFAIKGMLSEGNSVEDMAVALDRSVNAVSKYLESLDKLAETIADVQMSTTGDAKPSVDEELIVDVTRKLVVAGLLDQDAHNVVNKTVAQLMQNNVHIKDANKLYSECIKRLNAGSFMIKKSSGGRSGVAIMTAGASQRGDKLRKNVSKSRMMKGNTYDPSTGKINE